MIDVFMRLWPQSLLRRYLAMAVLERLFALQSGLVDVRTCRGVDLPELRRADVVFLDSDYRCRRDEFDLVKHGALVVVHDTRISYDSEISPHESWVRDAGGILFQTHRGFGLVRKR